ncbi:MAG: type III pantothenate kinase [Candidatus Zixiibacteriota bacterium]
MPKTQSPLKSHIPYILRMRDCILTVDIGNTTTHIGVFENGRVRFSFRLASTHTRTPDEASLLLKQILREGNLSPSELDGAVIASVVPVLTPMFQQVIHSVCDTEPVVVTHQSKFTITIDFAHPEQIGADRVANAEAFWIEHKTAGVVVDFGTATTFDVISAAGAFVGGAIAPGLETSADRLAHKAAQLPKVGFGPPLSAIGKTTEEALLSGVFFGAVGAVDEIVGRIANELGGSPRIIATGGLAERVAPESKWIQQVDPILTLKGLRSLYQLNR